MKNYRVLLMALAPLALAACGDVQDDLGLTKQAPDEFAVVKRAPLTLPPDYNLRPPQPGAPRPQEQETAEEARQTVFGETASPQTIQTDGSAELLFLKQAGANEAQTDIRAKVDEETANWTKENKPVAEKILDLAGGDDEVPATLVDPKKEAERLRTNAEEGKPVTEGETPTLDNQ